MAALRRQQYRRTAAVVKHSPGLLKLVSVVGGRLSVRAIPNAELSLTSTSELTAVNCPLAAVSRSPAIWLMLLP